MKVGKKKALPSPGSNSEGSANDTIGRFLQWGSLHFRYPIFAMHRLAPKNVAHPGGTIKCRAQPSDNDNHSHSQCIDLERTSKSTFSYGSDLWKSKRNHPPPWPRRRCSLNCNWIRNVWILIRIYQKKCTAFAGLKQRRRCERIRLVDSFWWGSLHHWGYPIFVMYRLVPKMWLI